MKTQSLLWLLPSLLLVACGPENTEGDGGLELGWSEDWVETTTQSLEASKLTGSPRVQAIKVEILRLALEGRAKLDNDDNDGSTRRNLEPLIQELLSLTPERTESEKLSQVVGEWQQVWADGPVGPAIFNRVYADNVYQIVFPDGYYYNVSRTQNFWRRTKTGLLRGKYSVTPRNLQIEFTNSWTVKGFTADRAKIHSAIDKAEAGELGDGDPFFGPVGTKGVLTNRYVDEDLRIVGGGVLKKDGSLERSLLYVLSRPTNLK